MGQLHGGVHPTRPLYANSEKSYLDRKLRDKMAEEYPIGCYVSYFEQNLIHPWYREGEFQVIGHNDSSEVGLILVLSIDSAFKQAHSSRVKPGKSYLRDKKLESLGV